MGKLLTKKEAAERVGLSRQTIQNWINKGALTCHKVGKAHFIDSDTIDALSDTGHEYEKAQKLLEKWTKKMQEQEEYIRTCVNETRNTLRFLQSYQYNYLSIIFYESIPNILKSFGLIDERESLIYIDLINGCSYQEISKKYDIPIHKIGRLIKKLILTTNEVNEIAKNNKELQDENKQLKSQLEGNKAMIERWLVDHVDSTDSHMPESERLINLLFTKVEDLDLSVRAKNSLTKNHFKVLADIVVCKEYELQKRPGIGAVVINAVKKFLEANHLHLGYDIKKIYAAYDLADKRDILSNEYKYRF